MDARSFRRRRGALAPLVALTLLLVGPAATAAAGPPVALGPDTTLGTVVNGVAAESGGTAIAVGADGGDVLVRRIGTTGLVLDTFDAGQGTATAVTVQPDGWIIVAGKPAGGDLTGFVRRYAPDGRLDLNFGVDGTAALTAMTPRAVTMAPGRRIVVGGDAPARDGAGRASLVRLFPNGQADRGFGRGGASSFDVGRYSRINAVVAQPDGRIVFAGQRAPKLQITAAIVGRASLSGALDRSFGVGGLVVRDAAGGGFAAFNGVALEPSGNVVAAGGELGNGGASATFLRTDPTGRPDAGFGSGGVARLPASQNVTAPDRVGAAAVAVAGGGELVGAGTFQDGGRHDAALWALTPSGAPDPAAGAGGLTRTPPSGADGTDTLGLSIAPSGVLFTGGQNTNLNGTSHGVVRVTTGFGAPPANPLSDEVPKAPPEAVDRTPALLEVLRARISGSHLDVVARLARAATGRLRVTYQANGVIRRFTVTVPRGGRSIHVRRGLPARARRGGAGLVRLAYAGSKAVRPETTRVRAGRRPAALRVASAAIDSGSFLVAAGTVASRATGSVLVRLTYRSPDGRPVSLDYPARIAHRRWRVEVRLPDAAASAGGALLVRYPGARARQVRGEQRARTIAGLSAG